MSLILMLGDSAMTLDYTTLEQTPSPQLVLDDIIEKIHKLKALSVVFNFEDFFQLDDPSMASFLLLCQDLIHDLVQMSEILYRQLDTPEVNPIG